MFFLCLGSCLSAHIGYCNMSNHMCNYSITTIYDNSGIDDIMTYIINSTCEVKNLILNIVDPIEISECGFLNQHSCSDMDSLVGIGINCMNLTIKLEKGMMGSNIIGLESHDICTTCLINETYKPNNTNITTCHHNWDCPPMDQCTNITCNNNICRYQKIGGCYKCKNITDCQFLNDMKYNNWFCNDVTGTCLHGPIEDHKCIFNEDCKKFNKGCLDTICNDGICLNIGNNSCCQESTKNMNADMLCELCNSIDGCQFNKNYNCESYSTIGIKKMECDKENDVWLWFLPLILLLIIIFGIISLIFMIIICHMIKCKL